MCFTSWIYSQENEFKLPLCTHNSKRQFQTCVSNIKVRRQSVIPQVRMEIILKTKRK